MPRRRTLRILSALALSLGLAAIAAVTLRFEYAPLPDESALLNPHRHKPDVAYDVLGAEVTGAQAAALLQSAEGRSRLAPEHGALRVDDALRRLGREAFYRETFGNEWFMSDVVGMIDGALSPWRVAKAVIALGGQGTSNLQVELADTVTIGGKTYAKGSRIATGLDVPRGGFAPLGMKIVYERGRLRAGATCALCHSTVDRDSGQVVEGAPNADLAVGLLLALATNSSAYLGHVTIDDINRFTTPASRSVTGRSGQALRLPDPAVFEPAVDAMLATWAPGNFDSTPDVVNNPTQIPDSFTRHGHPFGWSGFAAVGPFHGLNVLTNNVHGLNADMTTLAESADKLMGIDPEVYLGALLQNAADPRLRYDPARRETPSAFLRRVTPAPFGPGLIDTVALPSFPKAAHIATHSVLASRRGAPLWQHVSAISAFQDTLLPPPGAASGTIAAGREVFRQAGCESCHSGPAFTSHRVLPVDEIGAEPSRARALMRQGENLAPSVLYRLDAQVPVAPDTATLPVPIDPALAEDLRLAFAQDRKGGYKVKGLIGLRWSAPYLHEGGVAVGPDATRDLGLPGTLAAGVLPDPANSLRALIDRELRARVIAANRASPAMQASHASGEGHAHYVDGQAGYSRAQQDALIEFLLSITDFAPP